MSVMQTQRLMPLQFFRSSPAPCPYLPGRVERKLFARLEGPSAVSTNSTLSEAGFRRSHDIIYRPACPQCQACVPVRVPTSTFSPSENLEKVWQRGQQLRLLETPCEPNEAQYDLFIRYESARHSDSDMSRMSYDDYAAMLREGQADSCLLQLYQGETLMAIMLADKLADGYSAVYSFFAPGTSGNRYSLGTLLILHLIAATKAADKPYAYLGYWVENSQKMGYKNRFKPYEMLTAQGWQKAE
jgi:leucyl-tRNA---protein transferase